jgi:hypothetical protein
MGSGDYMERHAFRLGLRGREFDWTANRERLQELTGNFFDSIDGVLPTEWNGFQDLAAIKQHILTVLEHIELFENELQGRIG